MTNIGNNDKKISASAIVTLRFFIQNTQSFALISPIVNCMKSKVLDIRFRSAEFLIQILESWDLEQIKHNLKEIESNLAMGLKDTCEEIKILSSK